MNFEGFRDLSHRVARLWWGQVKREVLELDLVKAYLQTNPFKASQTKDNEFAYERLMDVRCKLYEISREIDNNHDAYMDFMNQCLENQELLDRLTDGLELEERHLVHLELMIMEQVEDWEMDIGKISQDSGWTKAKRMVVTLPDGKTRTIGISQDPEKRYWFGVCPVSNKIGNLKLCSGCRTVGYVGKEEQREDWPSHKTLCKALQSLRARGAPERPRGAEAMAEALRDLLGRKELSQYELDVCNFPRVCMVCGDDEPEALRDCKGCSCVAFCNQHLEAGKKRHEESGRCCQLRLAAEDYKNEMTLGHQVQHYSPKTLKTYQRLPDNIEKFFSADVASLVSNKLPGYQDSELRYLTFLYTCPLTALFGAEAAGQIRGVPLEKLRALTIHLVGSRVAEMRFLAGWEIIAHRLPALRALNVVFIGDECPLQEFPKDFTFKSKDMQADRKDLTIRYLLVPHLYQEYAKGQTASTFMEPDLVVALDCGFKFYPTWIPAFSLMLQHVGVPLIFTEFNLQDTKDDLDLVLDFFDHREVDVVVAPRRNPYTSRRPVRCSDKSGNYEPHSVIYTNDYVSVIVRNKSG